MFDKLLNTSLFFVLLVHLLCISGSSALAETNQLVVSSDKQFGLAKSLQEQKEFLDAIVEYRRFAYFFPDDDRIAQTRFNIGQCYYELKNYSKAILSFEEIAPIVGKSHKLAVQSVFKMSECFQKLNDPGKALNLLMDLTQSTFDIQVKDEALYQIGMIYLENASWDNTQQALSHISKPNQERFHVSQTLDGLEETNEIPRKSPFLAGALSAVVPGAGHMYNERYKDALIAFVLNTALIFAAYESFDNDMYAVGGLITLFELGFYSGNIYSAVNGAYKFNRKSEQDFIQRIKQQFKVNLYYSEPQNSFNMSFSFPF